MVLNGVIEEALREELARLSKGLNQDLSEKWSAKQLPLLQTPNSGEYSQWSDVAIENILESEYNKNASRLVLINGDIGCGKTSLATHIWNCWIHKSKDIIEVDQYKVTLLIDEDCLYDKVLSDILATIFPQTEIKYPNLLDWIQLNKSLMIVDDVEMTNSQLSKLQDLLYRFHNMDIIVFHRGKLKSPLEMGSISINYYTFKPLQTSRSILENCCNISSTIGGYLHILNTKLEQPVKGGIDFVWTTLETLFTSLSEHCNICFLYTWLLHLADICFVSLISNRQLNAYDTDQLAAQAEQLFSREFSSKMMASVFNRRRTISNNISYHLRYSQQQQVLAALHIIIKYATGSALKKMVQVLNEPQPVLVAMATLLPKILLLPLPQLTTAALLRLKSLPKELSLLHSNDPTNYSLTLIREFLDYPEFLSQVLPDEYFPKYLYITDSALHLESVMVLVNHVQPVKLHFTIESPDSKQTLELIIDKLKRKTLKMAIFMICSLQPNCSSDDPILDMSFDQIQLQDFSGSLSYNGISYLLQTPFIGNLVCLRLRLQCIRSIEAILNNQKYFTSLIWIEMDFDVPIEDMIRAEFPSIIKGLVDVTFFNISDENVPHLCSILERMSSSYSGIGIRCSSISIQGVTEILKYAYKKSILLQGKSDSISIYRRYRFPELSDFSMPELRDDDKVIERIGYDDRPHYSEHCIYSSYIGTKMEARALKLFLEYMDEIPSFLYVCQNVVIKKVNGNCCISERNIQQ